MSERELSATVVIPVYERSEVLRTTLAALEAQLFDASRLQVVIADDGSKEDIQAVVDGFSPPFSTHYVRQEHRGFGAGRARNLGAAVADGDVIVFLDSDGVVRPDFVSRHVAWHGSNRDAVVIGGRVHLHAADQLDLDELSTGQADLDGARVEEIVDFRGVLARRTGGYRETDEGYRAFVSANVSLPAELFAAVGGFDERFRWWGSEDTELGWRLWQAGATFIDDPENLIFHQLDADTAGGSEGRQRARALNRGLLTSLVPQRFYRKGMPDPPPEVPKVSVIVHNIPIGAPPEIWRSLTTQTLPDFEVLFVAEAADHDPWAGAAESDPRCLFVSDVSACIRATRGEYLVFMDGHAAPSPSFIQNLRKRLDQRPAAQSLVFGVETPGGAVVARTTDVAELADAWGDGLPISTAVRRRHLIRAMNAGQSVSEALTGLQEVPAIQTNNALVAMPSMTASDRPGGFTFGKGPAKQLWEEAQLGPSQAFRAGVRLAKNRLRPQTSPKPAKPGRAEAQPPGIRYIGWVGKDNLGDEVMVEAGRKLMPWGDVDVRGEARDLLLLGGGTLINRNQYLRWLIEHDSPRLERAVLGTGVASPEFWGLTEDTERWVEWLNTCVYVGVRGPNSLATLESWGYQGEVVVCGDLALALEPSEGKVVDGRVIVAPAWTNGELWGGDDQTVYEAMVEAASAWVKQGRDVIFMSCHPSDDRPILEMRDRIDSPTSYLAGYRDIELSLSEIARASVVVGERLHACVLAAAADRPFVAVEYRPKVRDFAASVGMEDRVMRSDEIKGGLLVDAVDASADATPEMTKAVNTYRERLRSSAEILRQSLQ